MKEEIQVWLEEFARSVRERNYGRGEELFHPSVFSYGTVLERAEGLESLKEGQWKVVWERTEGFRYLEESVVVIPGGEEGESCCVCAEWESYGLAEGGERFLRKGRSTMFLVKEDGRWLAKHSHFSMNPEDWGSLSTPGS